MQVHTINVTEVQKVQRWKA